MGKPRKRAAVILAAGKSTRMKSARSKVLHTVGGQSLLDWVVALARASGIETCIAVVGADNQDVRARAEALGLEIAVQDPQLGTAHAVLAAKDQLGDFEGDVVVLYADTPLISPQTLKQVFISLEAGTDVCVLGFTPDDPGSYGRLIEKDGALQRIVEAKDASPEELSVTLCNSGVMAASWPAMRTALNQVGNDNAKGEYYLTDIVGLICETGGRANVVRARADEVLGVNSRADLAVAEQAFQTRKRREMLECGVTLRDPDSVIFAADTQIEPDVDIGANVVFGPGVNIKSGVVIHPFCHIEGARIEEGAQIGPFARLRPGAQLGQTSKVGNFVEIKKSKIGTGSKVSHLSYIGDAELGEGVNIGAGTITCNYDGYFKHKTIIKDGAFVGTHSSLVAPVTIGQGAFLASGGVITQNVPDDALALARTEQTHKQGWAKRYHAAQAKRKAGKTDQKGKKS